MAFVDEVVALGPNRVEIVAQDERGLPDLPAIIADQPPGTAVYCCGCSTASPSTVTRCSSTPSAQRDRS